MFPTRLLLQSSTCHIGLTQTHIYTNTHKQTNPVDEQAIFTNCTVVSFSTVPYCVDDGYSPFTNATASTLFSKASHTAKTIFFLPASLLKVKKLQPSPINLIERPEADDNDLCKVDRSLASHSPFPKPHSLFLERHCFHPALAKFPTQGRRAS